MRSRTTNYHTKMKIIYTSVICILLSSHVANAQFSKYKSKTKYDNPSSDSSDNSSDTPLRDDLNALENNTSQTDQFGVLSLVKTLK